MCKQIIVQTSLERIDSGLVFSDYSDDQDIPGDHWPLCLIVYDTPPSGLPAPHHTGHNPTN